MIAEAVRLLTGNAWITDPHKRHESFMQKEVERGAKLLDEYYEGGSWRERIDFEKLDMGSLANCILGQLFGNYNDGIKVLGLSTVESARLHGFMALPDPAAYRTLVHSFVRLQVTWSAVLAKEGVPECQPA